MKIISLLMIVLASSIIYSQDELVHKEVMPYSSTNVVTNGDTNGIIKYGVGKINEKYIVPDDITVNVKNCSSNIAGKYMPLSKKIVICKEFIRYVENIYKLFELSDYEKSVNATILFILYHEFAHLFKDRYNIPIVGNEEIASDQFAALILLEDDLLYNHLEAYKEVIDSTNSKVNAWDEHPDYKQQYYNLICLLYGSEKDKYSYLADELHDRADRCSYEYNSIKNGWSILLNDLKR